MLVKPDGSAWVTLSSVAPTLQALLDDWSALAPRVVQFQTQCEAAGWRDAQALDHIALVVLLNDVSLRGLIPGELARGFGFYQSKPATSFAPIAVTPGALGPAWKQGMADLRVDITLNGQWFGSPRSAEETVFHFGQIIEHLTRTRALGAGTIVGAGTISNASEAAGNACITEARVRAILAGRSDSELQSYLRHGDRVTIRAVDAQGREVFGTIDQAVAVRRASAQD